MPSVQVALYDAKGRKVSLVPAGFGTFRVKNPLRSGLYFLKVGTRVLRLNHLR